jgi:hypothetical protein
VIFPVINAVLFLAFTVRIYRILQQAGLVYSMKDSDPYREERVMMIVPAASSKKIDAIAVVTCPISGRPHCGRVCPTTMSFHLGDKEEPARSCPSNRTTSRASKPLPRG